MLYRSWLVQVFAFIITGAVYFGLVQFGASVSLLMSTLTDSIYAALLCFSTYSVLALAVMIPLLCGIVKFEMGAISEEKASLSDLFYAFESMDTFARSYRVFLTAVLHGIVNFLPAIAVGIFVSYVYKEGIFGVTLPIFGQDGIYMLLNVLLVVFLIMGCVLSSKSIVGIYVCLEREEESVSGCFFVAGLCVRQSRGEMAKLLFSFVPLCVLSLFTLGFLFVMYTFPYIALSVTMFSKYLYEKEMYSKNTMRMLYSSMEEQSEAQNDINNEE